MKKNRPFERYEGIDEDAKRQDVPVKDNKADNSPRSPLFLYRKSY